MVFISRILSQTYCNYMYFSGIRRFFGGELIATTWTLLEIRKKLGTVYTMYPFQTVPF